MQSSPHTVQFDAADVFGGIKQDLENVDNKRLAVMRDSIPGDMRSSYTQQCYPLYSLLQALGNPRQRGDLSLVGISRDTVLLLVRITVLLTSALLCHRHN